MEAVNKLQQMTCAVFYQAFKETEQFWGLLTQIVVEYSCVRIHLHPFSKKNLRSVLVSVFSYAILYLHRDNPIGIGTNALDQRFASY